MKNTVVTLRAMILVMVMVVAIALPAAVSASEHQQDELIPAIGPIRMVYPLRN